MFGVGRWGKNIARNLHDLGALAAIVDPSPSASEVGAAIAPGIPVFADMQEALRSGEFDGAAIATPAATHADLAITLLDAGLHVFVEKPLALTVEDGLRVADAARAAGKQVMVGHLLLHHPAIRKAKQLVESGELGRIRTMYSHRLNLGTVRKEENALWSFAPHDISVILHLIGQSPSRTSCTGGVFLQPGIHDTTLTSMQFENGAFAHIYVSWLHPFKEHRLVIVGEKKMLVFEDSRLDNKLLLYDCGIDIVAGDPVKRSQDAITVDYENTEPLRNECAHFLHCIKENSVPLTDVQNGIDVLRILQDAQADMENDVSPARESTANAGDDHFVHETAIVDDNVTIGAQTKIWHWSHIQSGSTVGERCSIGQNVNVGNNVTIGNACKIQNNVSVYEGVRLEDYVFCGPSMVFTNILNPRSEYPQRGGDHYIATHVGKSASIGANATIVCGNSIGEYAFIGAGAVVTRDVRPHAIVLGNPAREIGLICKCGKTIWHRNSEIPGACPRCDFDFAQYASNESPA